VDYVRDRTEADVHVLVTTAETGGGGREYTVAFIGAGPFQGVDKTLKSVTTKSDTEDRIRGQLATTIKVGLLNYVTHSSVPADLGVNVRTGDEQRRPGVVGDRWKNWVFSIRGSGSVEAEESSREVSLQNSLSADRITPDWKITFGSFLQQRIEEFDLDEEEPVRSERIEREFNGLAVKGLTEHWSVGALGQIQSSTFDNIDFAVDAGPAVEYNFFPYSQYTRRQVRVLYGVRGGHVRYIEETLYGKFEETLVRQELSVTFELREQWGSWEMRVLGSQYIPQYDKHRVEFEGDVSWRVARGLSFSVDTSLSRIRDQLSLPRRGATPEEVLLRQRQIATGYQFDFSIGLTYTFGSIFSSVVNPRFGQ
jgi:hypothetical protein